MPWLYFHEGHATRLASTHRANPRQDEASRLPAYWSPWNRGSPSSRSRTLLSGALLQAGRSLAAILGVPCLRRCMRGSTRRHTASSRCPEDPALSPVAPLCQERRERLHTAQSCLVCWSGAQRDVTLVIQPARDPHRRQDPSLLAPQRACRRPPLTC